SRIITLSESWATSSLPTPFISGRKTRKKRIRAFQADKGLGQHRSEKFQMSQRKVKPPDRKNFVRRYFSVLGPGLITGAADDDPSGVVTYTIAGAQLGTSLLWTAFVTWPLMGFVQLMCARIGMVTGRGLGGALRQKIPRWSLIIAAIALFAADSITVGADVPGMADAADVITGFDSHWFGVIFGAGIDN